MSPEAEMESVAAWLAFFQFRSVNTIYVTLGCMILGATAGLIGCFAFLRKRALLGDALAHAALPGICMAFLLSGSKNPLYILVGAFVSCWLGALAIDWMVRHTRTKEDSALGIVLSVFFGVGVLLLSVIQQSGSAAQAGLDAYLFGQAAAMLRSEVLLLSAVAVVVTIAVLVGYKELKVLSFDPDFAQAVGLPVRFLEIFLASLIVLAVAIGLQTAGVVLMAALLVTPAAAARYWTERLGVMLVLAAVFGAGSGFVGAYVSYLSPQMPTGPWIVVAVTAVFVVSLIAAPERGMAARAYRLMRFRRRTQRENVLRTLYVLGEGKGHLDASFAPTELMKHRSMALQKMASTLEGLRSKGMVRESSPGCFQLTEKGQARAARLTRLHRLWELYLTRKLEIAPDHVHDDAEEIEHILTPELEARLVAALDHPEADPHAKPIPGIDRPREEG